MARSDYGPEIKSSMGSSPKGRLNKSPSVPKPKESSADVARDVKAGIKEGSPQDQKLDAMPANQAQPQQIPPMHMQGGGGPDPHSVGAATSIAHAILQHRPGSAY